ncbi:MAG: ribulokinase [Clostridiaceae bacterium]|nr:ribulokinase [Clostridiaceae bacterium]
MTKKLALGIDFGSLSGRALLVDVATGEEIASVVQEYAHGFIEDKLPASGELLPPDWTLQDPQDYLDVLAQAVPETLRKAGAAPADIVGVGIDFTACTVMPIKADGTPLCFLPEWKNNKHAYVKKWKHHAAQDEANRLTALARERGEDFLPRYGGKVSSEWLFPKLWQILDEAPEVYEAMDRFIEAADWIVLQLTGKERRNSCTAGYKALWNKRRGYPDSSFFKALDPRLEHVVDDKLSRDVYPIGSKAGEITPAAAALTGLLPGTAVAVGNVDAHVAVPAVGITEAGQMLMIMGTSTCHILLGREEINVPGICGVVEDGVLPGFLGYEAGQSCVGDHFDWFVRHCVPPAYHQEAAERHIGLHRVLREKAMRLEPGESGLLALDWWNGNRSILVDGDLTGMMLGMTLATKPEEIYRALIEATAFGTRTIIDAFEQNGLPIHELFACGGIAAKDPFMMQIYADVTKREIRISDSLQTVALGAAMFGAVAAGKARGGYDSIFDAARMMPRLKDVVYRPIEKHAATYEALYAEYRQLHDYFGRGANDVMKRMKSIRLSARMSD